MVPLLVTGLFWLRLIQSEKLNIKPRNDGLPCEDKNRKLKFLPQTGMGVLND